VVLNIVSYWIFTDIALDVDTLNNEQKRLLNECAEQYGMKQDDFSIILNSLKTIE
jgi:hypothetical protein